MGETPAYRAALKAAWLKPETILCELGNLQLVRDAVKEYVKRHGLPDGIFCYNDDYAFATMRAVTEMGYRVGKDCAGDWFRQRRRGRAIQSVALQRRPTS